MLTQQRQRIAASGPSDHPRGVFANPGFRRLWSGTILFQTGWWMQIMALGWLILERTDSPFMVALIGVFGWGPMLGLGLFGGMLADALSRTAVIRATHTASAIGSVALASLLLTGTSEVWHVYAAVFVVGTGRALDQSARKTLIHQLLGDRGVTRGLALDSAAFHGSKAIGPALAGGLTSLADTSFAYLACSAIFCSAALLMLTVPADQAGRVRWNVGWVVGEIVSGIRYAMSNRTILGVILITYLVNTFLFTYVNMIPVIARNVLGVGPGLTGTLSAADGVGSILGIVTVAWLPTIRHHGRIFVLGSLTGMLCLSLLSFSSLYPVSFVLILVIGLGTAGFSTMQSAIVMLVSRPEMRGRCIGVITLVIGAAPLGAVLLGAVADWLGPLAAVRINGMTGMFLLISVTLWATSLWRATPSRDR